jgi:predicted membrane protein DUF2142
MCRSCRDANLIAAAAALIGGEGRVFKRVWLMAFGVFFALAASWSLATPLGSTVDEPSHMIWASAVSTGQLDPVRYNQPVQWSVPLLLLRGKVRTPETLARLDLEMDCYAFKPDVPASCAQPLNSSDRIVPWTTVMATYNPLYYALVGWPVHVFGGLSALYAMRLMSALICAALLACAAATALGVGRVAFAGVLVAATPTTLSFAGSVNPNGAEAAGGLLAWSAVAALALDPKPELVTRRTGHLALGAGVITLVRPAGLEWLALLLATALVLLGLPRVRDLAAGRGARVALAGLGLTVAAAEAWNHFYGGENVSPTGRPTGYTLAMSVGDSIRAMPQYYQQMVGDTGWLDTPAPFGTLAVWMLLTGLLVLGAFLLATRRQSIVMLLLVAGTVLIPIAANAYDATEVGNRWTGRYLLWWAAGVPILAATVLAVKGRPVPQSLVRRLLVVVVALVALGQAGMYWIVVRRYGVGLGGPLLPTHFKWSPPMGWYPSALLLAAGLAGTVVLVRGRMRVAQRVEPLAELVASS